MSAQHQSDSVIKAYGSNYCTNDTLRMNTEDRITSTVAPPDQYVLTERESRDRFRMKNTHVVVEEIFLPNGQLMNAKTTMQSFDTPASRNLVSAAIKTRLNRNRNTVKFQQQQMILPSGELINAKNTVRSYHRDTENQIARDGSEAISYSNSVVAEVVLNNPNPNRLQFVDDVNVEAYPVQSYIVAKSEPIRPWLTNRFLYLFCLIIVIGSMTIAAGVYCGLGKCSPSRLSMDSPTATPAMALLTVPTMTLTKLPESKTPIYPTTAPTLSPTSIVKTKESIITEYINSVTLSSRTIRVNGTTAEDLALSWIIHDDPIFINIDDVTWSTLLLSSSNTSLISSTQIRLRQRFALLSLWFQQPLSTKGTANVVSMWRNMSGWLQHENECHWYGIKCSLIDMGGFIGGQRIVTEIDFYNNDDTSLGGNNITGTIPADFGLLTSLNRIDLSDNHFYGTIPESVLEEWVSVESIHLGNNAITGTIPTLIGFLTTLKILNITKNQITGVIPESIGQCIGLERLDAGQNELNGPLPDSIGDLTQMKVFNVQANHLNGTLPTSIGNWITLTDFYIYENQFHGTVPDTIGTWSALKNFNIEYNMFTGTLPYSIGQLSNVRRFDVSDNMLTGTIPESIGNCTSLVYFSIEDNTFNGTIPESIGMLTSLTALFLYSNTLEGTIPDVFGWLTSLRYMSVEYNELTGTIPLSVGNWSNIVSLQLYNNSFTGSVPNVLCAFNASNITADCDMVCECCTSCVQ